MPLPAKPESLLRSSAMGSGLISPWHIAVLALVLLLCFGPKRLPEMGRSLGKGFRELKDGITHHTEGLLEEPEATPAPRVLPSAGPRERDSI